jgi:tetratricopeptide (TPR) repeat protein
LARRDLLLCLALLLATIAIYSQVAHFEFTNYDDPDYTTANRHVRTGVTSANVTWAFTSSYVANWIPLTWISHMLDFQFFGANAGAHHITNLVLHLLNTLLLFLILQRMTTASVASAFVAAVFALHPMHIESVVWIAERKDLLCTFFFLLTIGAYVEFVRHRSTIRYLAMLVFFACALMSKPMAVTLPILLLLLDYWPLQQFKMVNIRRLLVDKLPLFAMAIAASVVTFFVQRGGGAVLESLPLGTRIENALVSYGVYLLKFVWPADLAVFYPYSEIPWWKVLLALAGLLAISIAVILRREKRQSHFVGWFWFLGTLIPVIGLVQVGGQARADRYTYIPLIGLGIMLAWTFKAFIRKHKWARPHLVLITLGICGAWGAADFSDLKYWHDSQALFQHAIEVTDGNYVAFSNLASAVRQAGHPHDAIPIFERALALKPHFADAENGLGDALSADKRFDEALPHSEEAVRLEPNLLSARINLGAAYSRADRPKEAEQQYRVALQIDPESEQARSGLGVTLAEQNRFQEALPQLEEAVRINPDYADGHYNLGRVLGLQENDERAMVEFREAIRVDPNNADVHYNLGTALAKRERFSQAADEFRLAVDLKPDYVNARFGYASALAMLENYDEAIQHFEGLLRLAPNFKPAKDGLEMCIYLKSHPGERPSANSSATKNGPTPR